MHNQWLICISFIQNSSNKAKSHHLIALLPVFGLFCFHLCRHETCFEAVLEIQRVYHSVWWFKKWSFLYKIRISLDIWIIKLLKTYHLKYIDLCIIDFLDRTNLDFKCKENRQYGYRIPLKTLKSARIYTLLFKLKLWIFIVYILHSAGSLFWSHW